MRHALLLSIVVLSACDDTATELDVDALPDVADDVDAGVESPPPPSNPLTGSHRVGTPLVLTGDAMLRDGSAATATVLVKLPAGTIVSMVFRTTPADESYEVLAGTKVGWISAEHLKLAVPPSARTLDAATVRHIVEPPGSGVDDHGTSYTDQNYWNFCAPGAVTALLSYFTTDVKNRAADTFSEPYGPHVSHTYWKSDDTSSGYQALGRSYLMHVAMESRPPTFTRAGLVNMSVYPTTGGSLDDSRDVLNWEASRHATAWKTFFYARVTTGSLTSTKLHSDITHDITGGHAVLAAVDTNYLPNWSRSLGHSIAIIGYDDTAHTYKFVDTCGKRCNGSAQATNGGVWTVSQANLFKAITAWGTGYVR